MDLKKVRYYHLVKQNLAEKASPENYERVLKEHIGLHSTELLTPYLSLRARIKDFDPEVLYEDINIRRNVVRLNAFRGTAFMVHRDNLRAILGSARQFLLPKLTENLKYIDKFSVNIDQMVKEITALLSGNSQLAVKEIKKELSGKCDPDHVTLAIRILNLRSIVVRTGQRYITDKSIKYGLLNEWLPDEDFDELDAEISLENLILKYIRIFGPVCLEDICWWLPATKTAVRTVLERLGSRIVYISFNGSEYIMEKEDSEKFKEFNMSKIKEPIVNFLPYEDHFPKAYTVRNWYISDEKKSLLFAFEKKTDYGQLRPSIWLNGEIAGRWETEWADSKKSAMNVKVLGEDFISSLPARTVKQIENERQELENYINEKLLPLMKNPKK